MFKMRKSVAAVAAILAGMPLMASAVTGPSTTTAPYLLPLATAPGWAVTSILTTGNVVGGYTMGGLPDGLGAFDNNDGTFTVLMNHEWNNTVGSAHTHNPDATKGGAYVSKWVIDKATLAVQSGGDLITKVYGWDNGFQQSQAVSNLTTTFSRFCSADLPAASALFNRHLS
ncbi:hypothetical protein [Methylobacter sp. S3L5C]|uniref:hypothetical protein n=1 Tax=Methylobacter sp. S3L5C TaxID=2839024 RepID=UPI001FABD04A|nr:hypothetical protein [Methylobacter sp. S3L5C]UOA10316.1 hypothetical protein KKZ03_08835 [Methylobacter sp. S3L5C]